MALQSSIVLFCDKPTLSAQLLQGALATHWPSLPAPSEFSAREDMLSFRLGASDVVIGSMPAPVQWSDLERPCATSILWPGAAAVLREHRFHAVVAASGELAPIVLATLLTQVTAALVAASSESVGVMWTNATLVVPPDLFLKFAVEVLPLGPPLPIWVDYRVGRAERGAVSAGFTTGLAKLGLMELETQNASESPSELKKRFEAIAAYLVENGLVIKDGDMVGEGADEEIRVVYCSSAFGRTGSVMRLSYEQGVDGSRGGSA